MTPQVHLHETPQALAEAFAGHLAARVQAQPGPFHLALSGGSTPQLLFSLLAGPYHARLPWERLHLWWGDERCVPPSHPESNYGVADALLIRHVPLPAANVHRILGEAEPQDEARRYASELAAWLPSERGYPVFDLILLGMGADGHTASIFPHQMELLHAAPACAVGTHPESGQLRVTFTGPLLNNAREAAFLVTGASKADKVAAILGHAPAAQAYPAAHIQPAGGTVAWWLDAEAAARL
ncbi:MAG: 6-phosphogluconolactonase [Bacteroidia bacterium]|nr:6-phosphogluconolactonase [Bacteroidia bacterium]